MLKPHLCTQIVVSQVWFVTSLQLRVTYQQSELRTLFSSVLGHGCYVLCGTFDHTWSHRCVCTTPIYDEIPSRLQTSPDKIVFSEVNDVIERVQMSPAFRECTFNNNQLKSRSCSLIYSGGEYKIERSCKFKNTALHIYKIQFQSLS